MVNGAYDTAKGMVASAIAPRSGAGRSLAAVCAWHHTQAIKSATRMFVDDHPSRRLWEPSQ